MLKKIVLGRSLEEIDEIFVESRGWLDSVRMAKKLPFRHLSEFGEK